MKKRTGVNNWQMMLIGSSSVIARQMFVVGLAVVSLAVWGVTMISLGVLRPGAGPRAAEGCVIPAPRPGLSSPAEAAGGSKALAAGAASAARAPAAAELVTIKMPGRDPFNPSLKCFPLPELKVHIKSGPKSGGASPAGPASPAARMQAAPEPTAEQLVAGLELSGIMVSGQQRLAIINGETYRVGDKIDQVLQISEITEDSVTVWTGKQRVPLYLPGAEPRTDDMRRDATPASGSRVNGKPGR